jgi:hypothetical protein
MYRRRRKETITLAGTAWVTVLEFAGPAMLEEVFMKVPTLANAATVTLGLFDSGFETDGDERWNSGAKAETAIYDILLERLVTSGGLLKIKANAAATEDVELVIYDSE